MVCTKEEFAGNLRARIAKLNITQQALSEISGIPENTIGRYCRGEIMPGGDRVVELASALGCDPNSLLGWGVF